MHYTHLYNISNKVIADIKLIPNVVIVIYNKIIIKLEPQSQNLFNYHRVQNINICQNLFVYL